MFCEVKARFGKVDIFVASARPEAAEFFTTAMDITLQQWDTAFDSQAKAFLIVVRVASALMPEGGRIISMTYAQGSRTGVLRPWVGIGSAKAAMESLVRYFAVALAKCGITINAISPGWTENSVLNSLPDQVQAEILPVLAARAQREDLPDAHERKGRFRPKKRHSRRGPAKTFRLRDDLAAKRSIQ